MRQSEKERQSAELNSKLLPFTQEPLERESLLLAMETVGDGVTGRTEIQSIKQKQGR